MSRYQKFVVALLAFLQFTVVLDFMTISPLGVVLMPALHITPSQFGAAVSVYAFGASVSGLLAAGFADRFDRRKVLFYFYCGFIAGTLLCGVASSYPLLLAARTVTGVFGGVVGATVYAIAGDLFEYEMRGRVMGLIQTAFAASQVLGIPAGLSLSNLWGWHAPFLMIAAVAAGAGVAIFVCLRPIDGHLRLSERRAGAFAILRATCTRPRHLQAFGVTMLLTTGGFMLMPFGSAFKVHNMGIDVDKLPLVYMATGLFAIVTGPLVGRAADSFGKYPTFVFGTALSILMVLVYTHLGTTPLPLVIAVDCVHFVGISSRTIPSQALISAVPSPESRGSFMAVSSSVQQLSGGVASMAAGMIIVEGPGGGLLHFGRVGDVVAAAALVTLFVMNRVRRTVVSAGVGEAVRAWTAGS